MLATIQRPASSVALTSENEYPRYPKGEEAIVTINRRKTAASGIALKKTATPLPTVFHPMKRVARENSGKSGDYQRQQGQFEEAYDF